MLHFSSEVKTLSLPALSFRAGREKQRPSEAEHEKRRAWCDPLQIRRAVDEPLIPGAALADQDGDVFLAVDGKRDRRSADPAAGAEIIKFLQGLGIQGKEVAVRLAREHQIRRGKNAAKQRVRCFKLAGDLA